MSDSPILDNLHTWLKGNADAVALCADVLRVAHTWDDLIDKDVPVSDEAINHAFCLALLSIPSNQFYRQHEAVLRPLLHMGVCNWVTATRLERSSLEDHRIMAYTLRCNILDVIAMAATIIGGPSWGQEVHYDIQVSYPERFSDYCAGLERHEIKE